MPVLPLPTASRSSCARSTALATRTTLARELAEFYDAAKAADIPEADRLARTIHRWENEVFN